MKEFGANIKHMKKVDKLITPQEFCDIEKLNDVMFDILTKQCESYDSAISNILGDEALQHKMNTSNIQCRSWYFKWCKFCWILLRIIQWFEKIIEVHYKWSNWTTIHRTYQYRTKSMEYVNTLIDEVTIKNNNKISIATVLASDKHTTIAR